MKWIHAKLSFEGAERMRRMRAEGATWKELQATFGVSKATVRGILSGSTYTAPPAPEPPPVEDPAPPPIIEPPAPDLAAVVIPERETWDDETWDRWVDLARRYEAGESLRSIGQGLGIDPMRVRYWISRVGVATRSCAEATRLALWIPLDDAEITRLYLEGDSMASIALRFGVATNTIRLRLLALGITRWDRGTRWQRGHIAILIAKSVHPLPDVRRPRPCPPLPGERTDPRPARSAWSAVSDPIRPTAR